MLRCDVQRLDDLDKELPHAKVHSVYGGRGLLGAATPVFAYDSGSLLSMQEALGGAFEVGIAAVFDAEFAGHEWQIEGRDVAGRYMEVDVDATTGAVLNVDR